MKPLKIINSIKNIRREKGQILVIVALSLTTLLMVIGLAVDMGYYYVSYSRVRRSVDAAALAATGEFKRGFTITGMTASATQQLKLNGMITTPDGNNPDVAVTVQTCTSLPTTGPDAEPRAIDPHYVLCPDPAKNETAQKKVRIRITQDVPMFFMAVLGIHRVPITVESISQAASLDVVLVIQNSEAMTYGAADLANNDPGVCNPGNGCKPFKYVKDAALQFVSKALYFPYDRISVVTFNRTATLVLPLTNEADGVDVVTPAINGLTVWTPPQCLYNIEDINLDPGHPAPYPPYTSDPKGPCRVYFNAADGGGYASQFYNCPMFHATDPYTSQNDPSWCGTTNPASGLAMAGNHLQGKYPAGWTGDVRQDAVWVVLLLATGAPNSAQDNAGNPICPNSTRGHSGCRDEDVLTRHCRSSDAQYDNSSCLDEAFAVDATHTMDSGTVPDDTHYDAYDRAFEMVDQEVQNGIFIFAIGLGAQVKSAGADINGIAAGDTFLNYAATKGGGIYRYTENVTGGSDITAIFLEIANKIATKINQ